MLARFLSFCQKMFLFKASLKKNSQQFDLQNL